MAPSLTVSPILLPALIPPVIQFSARSSLPLRSNSLWQIQSGFVRSLTWLEDGTTVMLGIWGTGEIIAVSPLRSECYLNCQLECMTKVEATAVPIADLPNYAELLLTQVHQLEGLMQIRSYKRVDTMLIKLLRWLAERFGKESPQGRVIDLRLTHLDMAEAIGTTRVTVTRVLGQLEQQGVLSCLPLKRIVLHQEDLWHYEI